MTMFLKATSEKAMKTLLAKALPGFVGTDEDGNEYLACYTHQWAVDWNIPIVSVAAVVNIDGTQVSPAVMETGFFANVAIHDDKLNIAALEAADQKPKNPQRVFG
jgi:hypothetical protein